MATTTNYSWTTPDDTALVKDGAAAIRSLGTAIDTTTKNLNPSTTLGDIEYRSSTANTNTRLGIGSTGNVLTVAGGVPTWAAPAGGGKVLQVVQGTLTSSFSTTSATATDIGLSVSITPSSATSKVMIMACIPAAATFTSGSATEVSALFKLVRTSTVLQEANYGVLRFSSSSDKLLYAAINFAHLDSPATTSATTYKIQGQRISTGTCYVDGSATIINSIIAMEIGA